MSDVVLITGGTSGIGLALAHAFMKRGAIVVVCGRSKAALDLFSHDHPGATAIKADVTRAADRAAMLDTIAERHGRIDVLVNNAGVFIERDFTARPAAICDLESEVAVNLSAPMLLTAEVLDRWPTPKAIVFVTSGYALVSPGRAPTYGATKFGLRGFADGLRRQLAPKGTHVLELLPPMTDTPMNAKITTRKTSAAEVATSTLRALDRRRPTARPGTVRFLPAMLRIAPRAIDRWVGAS